MSDDTDTTDDSIDREQTLDTAMDRLQRKKLQGRIEQKLTDAFAHRQAAVEQSSERFATAIEEGWTMHYAVATSGAHGWQIESADGLRLADGAYPEDVAWLVFENGWVARSGARWLKNDELAEWVALAQERRERATEQINEAEREAFEADDRLQYHTDVTGVSPAKGWWQFEPTGYIGRPEAVVAHAAGYDARRAEEGDDS